MWEPVIDTMAMSAGVAKVVHLILSAFAAITAVVPSHRYLWVVLGGLFQSLSADRRVALMKKRSWPSRRIIRVSVMYILSMDWIQPAKREVAVDKPSCLEIK